MLQPALRRLLDGTPTFQRRRETGRGLSWMNVLSGARTPQISIRLGGDGYHLFSAFDPGSVSLRPAGAEGHTDLILFACNRSFDVAEAPDLLPAQAWDDAANGSTRVVFDVSGEGKPHDPATTERLHGLLARHGVAFDHAAYLTQDRGYGADYADYCAAQGVGRRMRVLNFDYWIRELLLSLEGYGERLFARRLKEFRRRPRRRERRFMALCFTPRPTKVLLLLRLLQSGLWDQAFVSFGGFDLLAKHQRRTAAQFAKDIWELKGFEALAQELMPWMPQLQDKGAVALGRPADRPYDYFLKRLPRDAPLGEYNRSWFSVVAETEMLGRPCRTTEKPLKAMLNFHPAIILGNPQSLSLIRDLGFATF